MDALLVHPSLFPRRVGVASGGASTDSCPSTRNAQCYAARWRLNRTLAVWLFSLWLAQIAAAQSATVKKDVNLRTDSTTSSAVIELLKPAATLTLLDSAKQSGFYHVKAEDSKEGWVWSKNISLENAPSTSGGSQGSTAATECDASLWSHVYNPQRLIVKQQCIAVTGTIADATNGKRRDGVRHEADGDTHGWLDVDPQFKTLLNAGNLSDEGGSLVFEIVCKYHVTQADAVDACSGYDATVQIPPVGTHVRITGTYVQDTNHAQWMEIHPVTSIEVLPQ